MPILIAVLLFFDINSPSTIHSSFGYVLLPLCGLLFNQNRETYIFSCIAGFLLFFIPTYFKEDPITSIEITNRIISLIALIIFTCLVSKIGYYRKKKIEEKSKIETIVAEKTKDLINQLSLVEKQGKRISNSEIALTHVLEDLKIKEEKFRNLVESAPDAFVIANEQGEIQIVNSETERLFGYSQKELIGKNIETLLPNNFQDDISISKDESEETEELKNVGFGMECIGRRKDGTDFPAEVNLSPINTGKESVIAATIRDSTERKKFEGILKNQKKALESKNQELEKFAYIISHDLKAPLRAVTTLTEFIEEDLAEIGHQEVNDKLHLLKNRVRRMDRLIHDILEYSKIGLEKAQLSDFDPHVIISESVEALQPPENCKIVIEGSITKVHSSKSRFFQLMLNLIGNAIKYNDKENMEIKILFENVKDFHTFKIVDNGMGIEPKYHDKIFELFQGLNTNKEIDSTGVGLSVCKKITEELGGVLTVDSKLNEGSTFTFTLPIKPSND